MQSGSLPQHPDSAQKEIRQKRCHTYANAHGDTRKDCSETRRSTVLWATFARNCAIGLVAGKQSQESGSLVPRLSYHLHTEHCWRHITNRVRVLYACKIKTSTYRASRWKRTTAEENGSMK